ncbi:hypothetical protein B6N60_05204 [Richelia sinica FACHB-800]|uniref:Endonuclease GajA/Old nuclease/RecF-like AAA domain-containing protein n=2 Tax=Richelia TaxID=98443 RepID=A0A975TEC4_9NOST|nr:hypothetical protein B6N60_05204 [Richelia sinica FACHB-800]
MHIQRIQVPDFRALKNVDISFEKEFTPRIFPLGSQNGGGKSTLLQLIFVLLHCAGNPDRVQFIQNLLYGFEVNDESGKRTLAIIDIWDGSKTVRIDFLTCNESYILKLLVENQEIDLISDFNLSISTEIKVKRKKISYLERKITTLETSNTRLANLGKYETRKFMLEKEYNDLEKEFAFNFIFDRLDITHIDNIISFDDFTRRMSNIIEKRIEKYRVELGQERYKYERLNNLLNSYYDLCEKKKLIHICELFSSENEPNQQALLCKVSQINIDKTNEFLSRLSNQIFLTAHVSQIFLFLSSDDRKSLFKKQKNNQANYYQQIKTANSKLPGFFTYDFLAIDILIEAFKKARDEDFKQAVEQGGNYGNNYVKLLAELNSLLNNKKINVQTDLSGINFRIDGDETELYPEDLSHGELKRLCIYMWLKYNNIKDAIVLMDELEISFHPDWQYQIVRDLEEWGATNQYILATHSYEICQAVTPAHVKELEPKLRSKTI